MKKIIAIIPARMSATRFPGKPLAKILDLPMIEHVRRRVCLCKQIDEVFVATCDNEIRKVVEGFSGKVLMTSKKHERCTDRIEEAARKLTADIIVNVQGDEPLIMPDMLMRLVNPLEKYSRIKAACLIYPITKLEDLDDLNTVKAVMDKCNFIMFFSRSPIPNFKRGEKPQIFEQSGVMAYQKKFLHEYSKLSQTPLERSESVDMLRILEHGYKVYGVVVNNATIEVDIPEHVKKVEEAILQDKTQKLFYEKILKS
jgi:3-deoxy-manno-octulosonate cytidylyltransferase (CMP-KDO synthetase)